VTAIAASAPTEDNLLLPAPLTGALVGYGRISTRGPGLARQKAALDAAGCARCYFDKTGRTSTDRPELVKMLTSIRPGDVLTVTSLDQLGSSLEDLIAIVGRLKRLGVGFQSLHEKLDTTTPAGMFAYHVFAALAGFLRTIIAAETNDGSAIARTTHQRFGRPPAMTPERIVCALQLLDEPDRTMTSIAKLLRVSRGALDDTLHALQAAPHDRARLDEVLAQLPPDSRPGPPTLDKYDALLTRTGR
jgi:DNA invertase Pin-like site-specific DNA recombinase